MKKISIHLAIIILIALAGVVLSFKFLDVYTNRNVSIEVPQVIGNRVEDVMKYNTAGMRYRIRDSVYDKSKPRGVIVNQDPEAATRVKPGRTVYLTVNRSVPRMVALPALIDITPQIGIELLRNASLEIGKIDTVDSSFPIIVQAFFQGKVIARGDRLEEGSKVDIVIGKEQQEEQNADTSNSDYSW